MKGFWPCTFVLVLGYLLALPTLGLSLFLPRLCIADGQDAMLRQIGRQNRIVLQDKGLEIRLVFGYSTSWLEVRAHDKSQVMSDSGAQN